MGYANFAFLLLFLPVSLLVYYLLPPKARDWGYAVISLALYAFFDLNSVPLVFLTAVVQFLLCFCMQHLAKESEILESILYFVSLLLNLGTLVYFNLLLEPFTPPMIGVGVFTLLRISYATKVYKHKMQTNLCSFLVYTQGLDRAFLGPLWHYDTFEEYWRARAFSLERFGQGVWYFTTGLAKVCVLASPLGEMVLQLGGEEVLSLSALSAWLYCLGVLLYAYLMLSGISSMATGIGAFFGIEPHPNFAYPFSAFRMRTFVQRFHSSLSEYMEYFMGENARLEWAKWLIIGVLWCLWFRIDIGMLACGLFLGVLLALECLFQKRHGKALGRPIFKVLGRLYVYIASFVMAALLSQSTLTNAFGLLSRMVFYQTPAVDDAALYLLSSYWSFLLLGVLVTFCTSRALAKKANTSKLFAFIRPLYEVFLLGLSIVYLV